MLTNHGRPIRAQLYGAREIRAILGIGKGKAAEIIQIFMERGQAHLAGGQYKVEARPFEEWLANRARRQA